MSRRVSYVFTAEGTADIVRAIQGVAAAQRRAGAAARTDSARTAAQLLADSRRVAAGERRAVAQRAMQVSASYAAWKRAEQSLTFAVSRGAHDRERIAAHEAATRKTHLNSLKVSWATAEREYTRIVETESRRREAARGREGRGGRGGGDGGRGGGGGRGGSGAWGSAIRGASGAAIQTGRDLHAQYQDARRTRAEQTQQLGSKLSEAGASADDIAAIMPAVTAAAQRHGMLAGTVTAAIADAQEQFSVLGDADMHRNMSPADRRSSLMRRTLEQVEAAAQARNLGSDPGEALLLRGMFAQQGLSSDRMSGLIARTVAMAQHGSIPMGAVTRQAMQPIMARMSGAVAALPANATREQREAVMEQTYMQEFAQLQVLRARGFNPRRAGNVDAAMATAFQGNVTPERMRNNLRVAMSTATGERRTQIEKLLGPTGLFEEDPESRGRFRLRDGLRGNPLAVAARLSASGLNSIATQNIFGGGGHGNARGLQANWNAVSAAMQARDATGQTGAEVINGIARTDLTAADQARMAAFQENSPMAQLNRNEEARVDALTKNTDGLRGMSDRIAEWMAQHPVEASLGGGLLTAAGSLGSALIGAVIGRGGATVAANAAAGGLTAAEGAAGAAAGAAGLGVGALIGLGVTGAAASAASLSLARGQYWSAQGINPDDVDWFGNPTVVGGQESIRRAQQEHENLRLQRFDAATWASHSEQLAREQDRVSAHLATPQGQGMLRDLGLGADPTAPGRPATGALGDGATFLSGMTAAMSAALRATPITVNVDAAGAAHINAAPPAEGGAPAAPVFYSADGRR